MTPCHKESKGERFNKTCQLKGTPVTKQHQIKVFEWWFGLVTPTGIAANLTLVMVYYKTVAGFLEHLEPYNQC